MIYPVPQASSNLATSTEGSRVETEGTGDANSTDKLAGGVGDGSNAYTQCCQPMGMSTARWCTPFGGRERPGRDAYLYMIWNYRDCCVREAGSSGEA